MRGVDRASLATALRAGADGDVGAPGLDVGNGLDGGAGWPYPSLVLTALDHDATPLLLLSALAVHTANLAADARVGLLFDATHGLAQPLAGPRVTVLGRVERSDDPRHRARFLARHPGATLYMDFADFAMHRVVVERAHFVAGFGRVQWIAAADLRVDAAAFDEAALLRESGAAAWPGGWTLAGVDPDGADLRRGEAFARVPFDRPAADTEAARRALARACRRAAADAEAAGTTQGGTAQTAP